jgi:hypothetical protein
VLELDAGAIGDIAWAGRPQHQDDLAAGAGRQRVEAPDQFGLAHRGLGRGADEGSVGRQRIADKNVMGRGA